MCNAAENQSTGIFAGTGTAERFSGLASLTCNTGTDHTEFELEMKAYAEEQEPGKPVLMPASQISDTLQASEELHRACTDGASLWPQGPRLC